MNRTRKRLAGLAMSLAAAGVGLVAPMVHATPAQAASPSDATRADALRLALPLLAVKSPREALDLVPLLPTTQRGAAYDVVFSTWAETDPAVAATALAKIDLRPAERRAAQGAIARVWAMKAPRAALAWVDTLPAGFDRNEIFGAVIHHWAAVAPTAAAEFITTLPEGALRDRALVSAAASWPSGDPDGALAFVEKFPPGRPRDEAVGMILGNLANTDAKDAFARASSLPDGATRASILKNVILNWSSLEPDAALQAPWR